MTARDDLVALLGRHQVIASSKAEGLVCCKCDPTTWIPSHRTHLADVLIAAGWTQETT